MLPAGQTQCSSVVTRGLSKSVVSEGLLNGARSPHVRRAIRWNSFHKLRGASVNQNQNEVALDSVAGFLVLFLTSWIDKLKKVDSIGLDSSYVTFRHVSPGFFPGQSEPRAAMTPIKARASPGALVQHGHGVSPACLAASSDLCMDSLQRLQRLQRLQGLTVE